MRELFESSHIGALTLKNRFVRSATHAGLADENGYVTDELVSFVQTVSEGGAGLVITGHAYVSPEGQASPHQLGVHTDECIEGLTHLASTVQKSGAKILLQLAHAGCAARQKITGCMPIGPGDVSNEDGIACQRLDEEGIAIFVNAFADAAERAHKAGFDGVELHAAHGYALAQWLSPHYNKRTDSYGGTQKNRTHMLIDVIKAIRARCGRAFPLIVKINSEDFLENGLMQDDMVMSCLMCEAAGVDAIELSGGTLESVVFTPVRKGFIPTAEREVYYREACKRFKGRCALPLIIVGGIRSLSVAHRIVKDGTADYVALSRPLIRQPDLIKQWEAGNDVRATCLSCNMCFRPVMTGKGLYCVVEERQK